MTKLGPAAFAIATLCLFAACAPKIDLQAVQQYAQATADAGASFSTVAAGYYQSCLRIRELQLTPNQMPQTLVPLGNAYSASTPQPTTAPNANVPCSDAQGVSLEWDKRNAIVLGYVHALGAIAGVDVQPTFTPLGDALVNAKVVTKTEDSAFGALAAEISSIAISGEQREAIASEVTSINEPLKNAVAALKMVDDAYGQELNAEFNVTFAYYDKLIRSELPQNGGAPSPRLVDKIELQRQRYTAALTAINADRGMTIDYASVLDQIAKTHQELFDAAQSKPGLQVYISIIQKDVIPLYQDVESLRKATK